MKSLSNQSDRTEVLERLSNLAAHALPVWGQMNVHQMICHLHDSFMCATGEKTATYAGNAFQRTVVKWIALNAPLRWPPGVKTRPEMDQMIGGTRPMEFEADRKRLERMIQRFTAAIPDFTWHQHPIFGHMSVAEWQRWGYLHMDHHLRQFGA